MNDSQAVPELPELPEIVLWEHRCADGVGGCTAISGTYLAALLETLEMVSKTRYWREGATLLLNASREDGYRIHKDGYLETP
jgi:hypothetical protein